MILEYAQMLCTAHHVLDKQVDPLLYRCTHINHPCSIWVRQSDTNYRKLYKLFKYLCKEYTYRYEKIHKTEQKLLKILKEPPRNIPIGKFTFPPIAIADESIKIRRDGKLALVASYRNYYNVEKSKFATWKKRPIPKWFN